MAFAIKTTLAPLTSSAGLWLEQELTARKRVKGYVHVCVCVCALQAMELKYLQRAQQRPELRRAQRIHAATCLAGLVSVTQQTFTSRACGAR